MAIGSFILGFILIVVAASAPDTQEVHSLDGDPDNHYGNHLYNFPNNTAIIFHVFQNSMIPGSFPY
jgi:hypothetical protein